MSPPCLTAGIGGSNGSVMAASSGSVNSLVLKEINYLGFSDCSSVDSSALPEDNKTTMNLKATELRLGLPGSQSPDRDEKQLFPLVPSSQKPVIIVSGNKRGFSDTVDCFTESKCCGDGSWIFDSDMASMNQSAAKMEIPTTESSREGNNKMNAPPEAKAQVVGWPPIRSFRKNTLATTSKNNDADGKPSSGALFVKVSMDGAPYLRKVDLKTYSKYQDLSSALEKMFTCFIIGEQAHSETPFFFGQCREMASDNKTTDLHGSEYVLTYEDKDGDWMLVGDVPWEMFISSCKRLKIMKGCDAIGLAPGAVSKAKSGIE
ncbi:auxin-regulated protein [Genlisea aurea]|uniref:Auxin-responsive protein n=1 Tax=Genlisea aurea TaxID=192259 RepID=S8DBA3_9LAMI|nr:auxin-regulated protein [Genlisea aurea]